MLDRIQLNRINLSESGSSSYSLREGILGSIADALGMIYDGSTDVLYRGNNSATGIRFYVNNNGTICQFKIVVNGEEGATIGSVNNCTFYPAYLYYRKTDNGVIFGLASNSGTPILTVICSKGVNYLDGSEVWGYFSNGQGSSYNYYLTENGTYHYYTIGVNESYMNSPYAVSLAPVILV